jgi:hypothetical protein
MCGVVIHLCTHCGWCVMLLRIVFFFARPVPECSAVVDWFLFYNVFWSLSVV